VTGLKAAALAGLVAVTACTYVDTPVLEPPPVDAGCCCADAGPGPACAPVEVFADCIDGWARAEFEGTAGELAAVVALGELAGSEAGAYAWMVLPGLLVGDGAVAVSCGPVLAGGTGMVDAVLFRLPCPGGG